MFIIVPLILIAIAIIGISIIVWRKVPYLKKLDIESITNSGPNLFTWREFFYDILPEAASQKPKLREFKDIWLSELEKFVRRMRLVSLKLDRLTDRVIRKIRRVNRPSPIAEIKKEEILKESKLQEGKNETKPAQASNMAELKQKEQSIIIQIAKDPKNSELYKELSDLYVIMEQWADAKESIEAAIAIKPDDEDLKKKKSFILEKNLFAGDTK